MHGSYFLPSVGGGLAGHTCAVLPVAKRGTSRQRRSQVELKRRSSTKRISFKLRAMPDLPMAEDSRKNRLPVIQVQKVTR